jgi:hypothetical protein
VDAHRVAFDGVGPVIVSLTRVFRAAKVMSAVHGRREIKATAL